MSSDAVAPAGGMSAKAVGSSGPACASVLDAPSSATGAATSAAGGPAGFGSDFGGACLPGLPTCFDSLRPGVVPTDRRVRVAVLGATGSIGRQTLDVCRQHADRFEVVALSAHASHGALAEAAREFGVELLALGDADAARALAEDLADPTRPAGAATSAGGPAAPGHPSAPANAFDIRTGEAGILSLIDDSGADVVVNALVGAAGVRASVEVLKRGKRLALANKESLVVAGDAIMPLAAARGELVPIDSEHGAIFQCLVGEGLSEASRIWLTASGGPFRGRTASELADVTPAQALAHPTWNMGRKISIDSATLMNKGLEVIEAHHLFGADYDRVTVLVHPQSVIHSMVEFVDGSVKAHLGTTDMRIPIQYALSYPARLAAPVAPLDFRTLAGLSFDAPDAETFRCLALAFAAGREGGGAPAVLNAANEVAVAAFLDGRISFPGIPALVERCLEEVPHLQASPRDADAAVDELLALDAAVRVRAERLIASGAVR